MYDDCETEISRKHLREVVCGLEEPVVVLGGWAVFFTVNDRYEAATGHRYIGSRDIDLGFRIGADIEASAFNRAYTRLVGEMGFTPLAFGRLYKEIDRNTGRALDHDGAKKRPLYEIFPMYVDMIVDRITPVFTDFFRFGPIDEPLLGPVFTDPRSRTEIREFDRTVWLPALGLLLSMKLRSHPGRDREHKRIKDLADMTALVLFSGARPDHAGARERAASRQAVMEGDMGQVARILDLDVGTVRAAVRELR